jgi:DNA-binding winged helix-turn-helix (wHTH) protein
MVTVSDRPAIIEFGRFRIVPHCRQLLADGRPISLGGRTFDLLTALIEASGAVVSKDELLSRIWPDRIVEENRLQGEISALRKAFGADRDLIQTAAGRGYQFTGQILTRSAVAGAQEISGTVRAAAGPPRPPTNLPEPISQLVGREVELSEVTDLVTTHRLVTLTGEGGIGKTRLGVEIARQLLSEFADGVWVAELAPLSDPDLVAVTVATSLGLELSEGAMSSEGVANALGAKQLLLVLDNCEHVIDAAASMAGALLRTNSGCACWQRVGSRCGQRASACTVCHPSRCRRRIWRIPKNCCDMARVQLFVARARSADPHFSPEGRIAAFARRSTGRFH